MNASNVSTSLPKAQIEVSHATVRAEYERADCFCVEVQRFRNKAGIPAINELRNAGKHLFDAVENADNETEIEHLRLAHGHARRAAYEAYEAGIMTALEIINKFKNDYALVQLTEIIPDYPEVLMAAHKAQGAVDEGRQKGFDRAQDHQHRMEAFRELRAICERLDVMREEANKLVAEKMRQARSDARGELFVKVGLAIAGVSALATIIFGGPGFYDWWVRP